MTPLGQTLCPILEAMCHWGAQNAGDKYELTHPQCASPGGAAAVTRLDWADS